MARSREERIERMAMLMNGSHEVINEYMEVMIEQLHESLEQVKDANDFRFIQGQIAGIRDFCSFVQE